MTHIASTDGPVYDHLCTADERALLDARVLYAGFLSGTHVGATIRVRDIQGVLHKVIHENGRPRSRCVIYARGDRRDDGSMRKVAHVIDLSPREVITVVES